MHAEVVSYLIVNLNLVPACKLLGNAIRKADPNLSSSGSSENLGQA